MKSAIGFVVRHPYLRALFAVVAFHCAMTMSFEALFPAVSFNVLDAGREGVSYLMMASARAGWSRRSSSPASGRTRGEGACCW